MDQFFNAIRQQAAAQDGRFGVPRWGIVQSVDPSRPAAKVMLQPEGVLTGWLPILQPSAAGGWGVMSVPSLGAQALVQWDAGSSDSGVIVGFAHSDANRPAAVPNAPGTGGTRNTAPSPAIAGETILTHASGCYIRLLPSGDILLGAGTVRIDGNLIVNGDVADKIGALNGLRQHYNTHRHTGVQPGGGQTATTTVPDP